MPFSDEELRDALLLAGFVAEGEIPAQPTMEMARTIASRTAVFDLARRLDSPSPMAADRDPWERHLSRCGEEFAWNFADGRIEKIEVAQQQTGGAQ